MYYTKGRYELETFEVAKISCTHTYRLLKMGPAPGVIANVMLDMLDISYHPIPSANSAK